MRDDADDEGEEHEEERIYVTTDSEVVNLEGSYVFADSALKKIDYYYAGTEYSLMEQHAEEAGHEEEEEEGHHEEEALTDGARRGDWAVPPAGRVWVSTLWAGTGGYIEKRTRLVLRGEERIILEFQQVSAKWLKSDDK
jgi:hypothetical protein